MEFGNHETARRVASVWSDRLTQEQTRKEQGRWFSTLLEELKNRAQYISQEPSITADNYWVSFERPLQPPASRHIDEAKLRVTSPTDKVKATDTDTEGEDVTIHLDLVFRNAAEDFETVISLARCELPNGENGYGFYEPETDTRMQLPEQEYVVCILQEAFAPEAP